MAGAYFLAAEDLQSQRRARGWSAADLARQTVELAAEVGTDLTLSQQAVSQFENKKLKSFPRWLDYAFAALELEGVTGAHRAEVLTHKFGRHRALDRAPSTLSGEMSWVTLRVALPSEAALADMFEAQLQVFGDLQGPELARALAKRLPSGIARLQAAQLEVADAAAPLPKAQSPDHRASSLAHRR